MLDAWMRSKSGLFGMSPGRTGTASWTMIGPPSREGVDEMDRDSRHFDPGGESVANAVRAGERRQQRRVDGDQFRPRTRPASPAP